MADFYIRRALRICPTYYLALLYAFLAGLGVFTDSLPWFAAYLTNFYIVRRGLPGSSTHLWSLAVEEQFYLIWPVIILLLPRRALFAILGATIAGGMIYRGVATAPHSEYLLPACMDYLAAGAVLAIVFAERPDRMPRLTSVSAALSIVLFALGAIIGNRGFFEVAVMALSIWLVGGAARGIAGPFGHFLQARPVTYAGRISYGLYLVHNFIPEAVLKACSFYRLPAPSGAAFMLLVAAMTFAIAATSWHVIERPLRDLRKHFSVVGR